MRIMEKEEMKFMLKELLKECELRLNVNEYGDVRVDLLMDNEVLVQGYTIDLLNEVQDAKDSREARAWT